MPILRVAYRHKPYSQLGNAMLRDVRLSPQATGVLVFIMSHPADWQFNLEWLAKVRGISRRLAQRVMREMIASGYCSRHRAKRPDGTWEPYEYLFTDEPDAPQDQNDPVVHLVHKPRDQNPRCGERTPTKKGKDTNSKKGTSKNRLPTYPLMGGSGGKVSEPDVLLEPLDGIWGGVR